ncbi:ABC-F family ATP-binding cassette domain-containing protein [Fictibacillus fluitans]|uniref:ABC-F family ATP-binding cassette domain-containing protein n=1 Tax=Fictibacillus fluitans TaxID=3058422 RepID=A0ABT8I110_9BACL|nr:ABC-F family ATP-binding cassette domain-containing protein [Fictibacillus sp. NE201]MDN4526385.1 ABC-F family ATP-binding cassette domain-containing protein [Fictibacillus sp. NE201]
MIILQVNDLAKSFGADPILSNIKLEVQTRDRIALVGRNGAGKSTLLKIITGDLSYDSGQLIMPKGVKVGYLAQDTGLESSLSIWDEMLSVFEPLRKMEKQLRSMESRMGDPALIEDENSYNKLLKEYDELQITFKELGGYQYEAEIRTVLHGFQFADFDPATAVSTLSGGQKTRLALAKLLLTKPDLLILDEPTNHLDIETLSWLEQYLQSYPGAILLVSHDRYFLDKIVTGVYEITRHRSYKYKGNYTQFLEQKAERLALDMKAYEKQQGEIAKLQDFVQKNLVRASTTKRAQSRRKQLERMEVMDKPLGDEKSASFMFDIERQSGNDVLKLEQVATGYEDGVPLIKNINYDVSRQDAVALVGPNGIGKSTLLKAILKQLPLLEGNIRYGANVKIGHYDQEQANLNSRKTLLNELWDEYPDKTEKEIRTILGNFLFSGDDVLKFVNELSGGQKARLALAKLMMQKANLLLLDEPTNHLDLDSKEVLEQALINYPGTIVFVSHDRYFINRIATKVAELSRTQITSYLGDYDYFVDKKRETKEREEFLKKSQASSDPVKKDEPEAGSYRQDKAAKREDRKRLRRIEEIEALLETLEARQAEHEEALCDPEIFQDYEKTQEHNQQIEVLSSEMEQLMEEWEQLQEEN